MKIQGLVLLTLLGFSTVFFSCTGDKSGDVLDNSTIKTDSTGGIPKIEFLSEFYDFGKIVEGEVVAYTFKFRNIGAGGLVITSASATCGCTIPRYSKQPVAPGEIGKIEVVFDSQGKIGAQKKTIAIRTNAKNGRSLLIISAEVSEEVN